MTWSETEYDDLAWAGPFSHRDAALAALDDGIVRAGFARDDNADELVHVPLARAGESWWAGMPASLVGGPERFLVLLALDPDNEWGPPIGYDIHPIEDREGKPHFGPALRAVREETHPDHGAIEGALAEIARRAGNAVDKKEFEEIGIRFPT